MKIEKLARNSFTVSEDLAMAPSLFVEVTYKGKSTRLEFVKFDKKSPGFAKVVGFKYVRVRLRNDGAIRNAIAKALPEVM